MPFRQLAVIGFLFLFGALRLTGFFAYPSFYAEDGAIFFKESINLGLSSLFTDVVGHHNFIQRLAALLSLNFPILWVPTIYKVVALLLTSWCFSIFARPGFRWLVPDDSDRMILCVLFSLLPGANEVAITICTFYYPFLLAALLIILEKDAAGRHQLSIKNLVVLCVLFFSTGHAIICLPLLLYFTVTQRSRNFGCAAFVLMFSVALNMLAVLQVAGPYQFTGRSFPATIVSSARIWFENFFARVIYLPLFGAGIAQGIIQLPDLIFWSVSLFILLTVLVLTARRGMLSRVSHNQRAHVLGLLVASVLLLMPLSVLVRSYLLPIYTRPGLSFEYRYSFLPAFAVLLCFSSLLLSARRLRRGLLVYLRLFLFLFLAKNLIAFPIFPDIARSLEFEAEWPGQAARIEAALERRELGKLHEAEPIGFISCLPQGWHDFDRYLRVEAMPKTLVSPRSELAASFRAQDFVVRHAAFQLFRNHQSPYELSPLRALEFHEVGWDLNTPFLNPPWTLLLLSPVLVWSYLDSALLWALANACFFFLTIVFVFRTRPNINPQKAWLLLASMFLPGIFCWIWGQLGLLLALGVSLIIYAESRSRFSFGAVGVLLLTLKPHLVFLPALAAFYEFLRRKDLLHPILLLFGPLSLLACAELFRPGITSEWLTASRQASADLRVMRSTNLPALLGLYLGEGSSINLSALLGLPLLMTGAFLLYLIRNKPKFSVEGDIGWLLPLSLMFTPYAWHHDLALLLPVHALLVLKLSQLESVKLQRSLVACIVLFTLAVLVQMVLAFRFAAEFAWISIFYFVLGVFLKMEEKRRAQKIPAGKAGRARNQVKV